MNNCECCILKQIFSRINQVQTQVNKMQAQIDAGGAGDALITATAKATTLLPGSQATANVSVV